MKNTYVHLVLVYGLRVFEIMSANYIDGCLQGIGMHEVMYHLLVDSSFLTGRLDVNIHGDTLSQSEVDGEN